MDLPGFDDGAVKVGRHENLGFDITRLYFDAEVLEEIFRERKGRPLTDEEKNQKFVKRDYLSKSFLTEKYSCLLCGLNLTRLQDIQEHIRWVHTTQNAGPKKLVTYKCSFCPMRFERKYLRENHEATHSLRKPPKTFMCQFCNQAYSQRRSMEQHISRVHPEQLEIWKKCQIKPTEPIECEHCQKSLDGKVKTFLYKRSLVRHIVEVHPTKPIPTKCKKCNNWLISAKQKQWHESNCFGRFNRDKEVANSFSSKQSSDGQDDLKDSFHKKIPYGCTTRCHLCDKPFTMRSSLIKHFDKVHPDQTPIKCQVCNLRLLSSTERDTHEQKCQEDFAKRTKQNEKEVTNSLPNEQSQNSHLELKYSFNKKIPQGCTTTCHLCEKTFTMRSSLIKHVDIIHPGQTPMKCQVCNLRLLSTTERDIHEQICKQDFVKRTQRNERREYLSGVIKENFSCVYCDIKLFKLSEIIDHIRACKSKTKQSQDVNVLHAQYETKVVVHSENGEKITVNSNDFEPGLEVKEGFRLTDGENISQGVELAKPFKCQYCPKRFAQKSNYIKIHEAKCKDASKNHDMIETNLHFSTSSTCDIEPSISTFEDLKMELSEDWNNEDSGRDSSDIETVLGI